MITNNDLYAVLTQMIVQLENISWSRFYNFLMGSSILVLAWTTLYVSSATGPYAKSVLVLLCLIGVVSGPIWAKVGKRARQQLEIFFQMACRLEANATAWESDVQVSNRPFSAIASVRDDAVWYSRNAFVLQAVPWAFSVLNAAMMVATLCR
jgi:hypothetical protein